jgi:hypothetical protein
VDMTNPTIADRVFWLEQYQRAGEESFIWLLRALELKRAADLLAPVALADLAREFTVPSLGATDCRPVTGPYMLLAGSAV